MLHNLHRLHVSLAVAMEGRVQEQGPNPAAEGLAGLSLAEARESCFPLWLCHRETRAGERKGEGIQKQPDQEQAQLFLAVVPLLKGEPAVNRGECEAPVDSYNRPPKPLPCVPFPFFCEPPVW